jgi:hypothetical protein
MSFSIAMQPAGLGQGFTLGEGEVAVAPTMDSDEQAQIQKIEEQTALLLKESEIIMNLSRQLMEQSHGEPIRKRRMPARKPM